MPGTVLKSEAGRSYVRANNRRNPDLRGAEGRVDKKHERSGVKRVILSDVEVRIATAKDYLAGLAQTSGQQPLDSRCCSKGPGPHVLAVESRVEKQMPCRETS